MTVLFYARGVGISWMPAFAGMTSLFCVRIVVPWRQRHRARQWGTTSVLRRSVQAGRLSANMAGSKKRS
jgi:hypothetical protein